MNLLFGLALQLIINFLSANVPEAQPAEASHPVAPVPTPRARKSKVGEAPPSSVSPSASVASNASADLISFTQPAAAAAADSSSSSSPLQQHSPSRVSLSGIAAGVPPATAAKPVQPPARPALPPMPRSVPPPIPAATYKSPTSAPLAPQTKANVVAAGSLARTVSVEEEVVPSAPPMPDYMTNEGMSLMQSPPVPQSAYPPVPLYPMPGFYPPPHTVPEAQPRQLSMSQLPYPAEFAPTRPPPYPNASTATGTSSSTSTSAAAAMSSSSNRTSASAMPSPPPYVERPPAQSMYPPIVPPGVSSTSAPTLPPSSAPAPNVLILQQEHIGMYIREHFVYAVFSEINTLLVYSNSILVPKY